MQGQKQLLSVLIIFAVISATGIFTGSNLSAEDFGTMYRIKINEEVLSKPYSLTAWQYYGQCKKEWRTELYFKQFPNAKKYKPSYKEELNCRRKLAQYWIEQKKVDPGLKDRYLDDLVKAYYSMYFPEYVYKYFKKSSWNVKKNRFRLKEYKKWAKKTIRGHRAKTMAHLEKTDL